VPIHFSRSSSRHGISRPRALHVVETCPLPLYSPEPEDEDLVLFLGLDPGGVALEVMAIELEGGLLVIHAMKLRPKYREAFWQVMESQRR
jgi:hypothetical protein